MQIELKNVSKKYASPGGASSIEVLKDIDLSVDKGESVAIVGPSGCGKSTLLNLIGGLDQPDAGDVAIAGKSLKELDEDQLATFRNQTLGFIFQLHHLLPQCTLLENTLIPTLAGNAVEDKAKDRAMNLLKRLGIDKRADHFPAELSGGEQLRAAVARALINQPEILLADEPTGSLDQSNANMLTDLILEINESFMLTLVLVTHSEAIAKRMKKTYHLDNGALKDT